MKLYHETKVPEEDPKSQPPTDPLALKLWHLDQQMAKKRQEALNRGKKEEARVIVGIPGNTIDEKLHVYHQNFLRVAKSFVANI
jgi:hypothetical protein